jgi:hypothetical protein
MCAALGDHCAYKGVSALLFIHRDRAQMLGGGAGTLLRHAQIAKTTQKPMRWTCV